ncbi:hypothetical protein IAI18_15780 [Acetobacteraceae bacterium H6797]|nr:hypothetical protein [Acetobacteraceae bacterium H6797]
MRSHALVLAAAAAITLVSCGPLPAPQSATLPADLRDSAADPIRGSVYSLAYTFGTPSSVAGNPAAVADTLVKLEYLATALPGDPRSYAVNPVSMSGLNDARAEARSIYGIAPTAAPQEVIQSLHAAASALRAGDAPGARQMLAQGPFSDPARSLAMLNALPAMPITAAATRSLANEFTAMDSVHRR